MQNRTDLALELKEEKNIGSAQSGIIVKTRIDTTNHIKETKIKKSSFLISLFAIILDPMMIPPATTPKNTARPSVTITFFPVLPGFLWSCG